MRTNLDRHVFRSAPGNHPATVDPTPGPYVDRPFDLTARKAMGLSNRYRDSRGGHSGARVSGPTRQQSRNSGDWLRTWERSEVKRA